MKFLKAFFVAAILLGSASAQLSKTEVAIRELRKSHPAVKWNSNSATIADFTCDGKPDTVVLGSEKNDVVVGSYREPTQTKSRYFLSLSAELPRMGSALSRRGLKYRLWNANPRQESCRAASPSKPVGRSVLLTTSVTRSTSIGTLLVRLLHGGEIS